MGKRHLFYISIALLLISCNNNPEDPQEMGAIYGVVTDYATGEPVQNANVQLRPTGETTLTGSNGTYEILNLSDGNYSLTISKAEYTDLIDDYVIKVKDGRRVRRDVQIEKIPTYIRFTDMMGHDITELDFGSDAYKNMLSFNVYNNGTVKIDCEVVKSCEWITTVSPSLFSLSPGQNSMITVQIDRSKLAAGYNTTDLYIKSNNGNNVLHVKATSSSGNPPIVQILSISNVSITSVQCKGQLKDANGGIVTDCGFCYSKTQSPTIDNNVIHLGSNSNSFSCSITNLENDTKYFIRAFGISNLGVGYSSECEFTTLSGLPICGPTTITNLDPTTARGQSSVTINEGTKIDEKGFCWSMNHTPTINDYIVKSAFGGEGMIYEYLSSLQPSTTYRVRSYAKNDYGVSYGEEAIFTSLSGLATITTATATVVGTQIVTGGNVTDDAGTVVLDKGVCYGTSPNPNLSWSFDHTNDGSGTGAFSSTIPKPSESGTMYIRAYATTKYGTSYGNQVSIMIR